MLTYFSRFVLGLVISFVLTHAPVLSNNAYAGMITTADTVTALDLERSNVVAFMQRDDVQKQLIKLGVDPKEANSRIANLSDKEVKHLSNQIDQYQAGGWIGGLLVLVVLVLLIVYLAKRV